MTRGARTLALAGLLLLAGCSTFERDWAAMAPTSNGEATIEGRWSGTWRSDVNGHHGGLRCIIRPANDGSLQARYRATWGWGFTFEYTVPMSAEPDGDGWRFAAEADLGWLAGGRYEYAGSVTGDAFISTYRCARDHGTFQLRRAEAGGPEDPGAAWAPPRSAGRPARTARPGPAARERPRTLAWRRASPHPESDPTATHGLGWTQAGRGPAPAGR
jgi:hypothetical protein